MKSIVRMWDDLQKALAAIKQLQEQVASMQEQITIMQQAKKPGRPRKNEAQ